MTNAAPRGVKVQRVFTFVGVFVSMDFYGVSLFWFFLMVFIYCREKTKETMGKTLEQNMSFLQKQCFSYVVLQNRNSNHRDLM